MLRLRACMKLHQCYDCYCIFIYLRKVTMNLNLWVFCLLFRNWFKAYTWGWALIQAQGLLFLSLSLLWAATSTFHGTVLTIPFTGCCAWGSCLLCCTERLLLLHIALDLCSVWGWRSSKMHILYQPWSWNSGLSIFSHFTFCYLFLSFS